MQRVIFIYGIIIACIALAAGVVAAHFFNSRIIRLTDSVRTAPRTIALSTIDKNRSIRINGLLISVDDKAHIMVIDALTPFSDTTRLRLRITFDDQTRFSRRGAGKLPDENGSVRLCLLEPLSLNIPRRDGALYADNIILDSDCTPASAAYEIHA